MSEDDRDIFEKALGYGPGAAAAAIGAVVGGRLGRKLGGRLNKADTARFKRLTAQYHENYRLGRRFMSEEDWEWYWEQIRRSRKGAQIGGAAGAVGFGVPSGLAADTMTRRKK